MSLPETTPAARPPPILGYAGAEATQLNPRALARIRLGGWFLMPYMASSISYRLFSSLSFTIQYAGVLCAGLFLAVAACLLTANPYRPSERSVRRLLLLGATLVFAVTDIIYSAALHVVYDNRTWRDPTYVWLLDTITPFNLIACGLVNCLCFLRLAEISHRFNARAIAIQCLVAAVLFFAFYFVYLLEGRLYLLLGIGPEMPLRKILAFFRLALSLWSATFLACLLPRLKSITLPPSTSPPPSRTSPDTPWR